MENGLQTETNGAVPPEASYYIYQSDGRVVGLDGRRFEEIASGQAGADDAAVIQSVFDAASAPGPTGKIFIKNGTYEIHLGSDGPLTLSASQVEVVSDLARLRFHPHEAVVDEYVQIDFWVHGGTDVRIQGLILDGNPAERSGPSRTLVIEGGGDVSMSRVTVEDSVIVGGNGSEPGEGYGIGGPDDGTHFSIHNCIFTDAGRHAIHPGEGPEGSANISITNNTFLNNGWGDPRSGAVSGNAAEQLIANNYFRNNDTAIGLTGATDPGRMLVTGNVFIDDAVDRPGDFTQVAVHGTSGRVAIHDNIFSIGEQVARRDGTSQLVVESGTGIVSVRGNQFDTVGSGDGAAHHLHLIFQAPDGRVTVDGNEFEGLPVASEANAPGGRLTLSNNQFHRGGAIRTHRGDPDHPIERINIEDNVADDLAEEFAVLEGVRKAIVRSNTVSAGGSRTGFLALGDTIRRGVVSDNVLDGVGIPGDVSGRAGVTATRNVEW